LQKPDHKGGLFVCSEGIGVFMVKFFIMAAGVNIQERKLELIQWLSTVDDLSVIDRIADLKSEEDRKSWDEVSEGERESVLKGLQDAEAGKLHPHSTARKIYEKWL
jgi:hypothetical protein